jgi:hypothetical protein
LYPRRFTVTEIALQYYVASDASTAVNFGQGNLKVTYSRGYSRKSLVLDGGFESYQCANGGTFCFTDNTAYWHGTSSPRGTFDASIFHFASYAHAGNAVAILGSSTGSDTLAGTLFPAKPLDTEHGKRYIIQFFHWSQWVDFDTGAFVDIIWNGEVVKTIRPGYSPWTYFEVGPVEAKGKDTLAFHGGKFPAYSFIDDVHVFAM